MDASTNYKFRIDLIQQSPIIHFQYDKPGATLRATEVKPKLDKFILKKLTEVQPEWYAKSSNNQTTALDYKMRIYADTEHGATYCEPNKQLYFGNVGDEPEKYALTGNCVLEIVCFHENLLRIIKRNLNEFFVVTNFGTRQNKGFGSYLPKGFMALDNTIASWLCAATGSKKCYKFYGYRSTRENPITYYMFNDIRNFSSMKSYVNGRKSFLSTYFKNGIKNEKDWINENYPESDNYKYTRALLGIGPSIANHGVSNGDIDRLASPIFFKIIGNKVYVVAKRINPKIYEKKFNFEKNNVVHELLTPSAESFDIDDFVETFIKRSYRRNNNIQYEIYNGAGGVIR